MRPTNALLLLLLLFISFTYVMYLLLLSFPDCKFNCHKRCAEKVPKDCLGEAPLHERKSKKQRYPGSYKYLHFMGNMISSFTNMSFNNIALAVREILTLKQRVTECETYF